MKRMTLLAAALLALPAPLHAQAADALFELLCGRTTHFYDGVGNQIEYTSGDGTAYLWYHEEAEVIVGTWGVFFAGDGAPQVCYEYEPGSFGIDLITPTYCFNEEELFETVVQGGVFNGDRYGLADGTPPYTLPQHPFVELHSFDADFPELPPEPACGIPVA